MKICCRCLKRKRDVSFPFRNFPKRAYFCKKCKNTKAKALRKIKRGNRRLGARYLINQRAFSNETLESYYWAGFFAADGGIIRNSLDLTLQKRDLNAVEKFKSFLSYNGPIRTINVKNRTYYKVYISGIPILTKILKKKFNITERKSLTLRPPIIKNSKKRLAFIIGYLDGDGCIYQDKETLQLHFLGTRFVLKWILEAFKKYCPEMNPSVRNASCNNGKTKQICFSFSGGKRKRSRKRCLKNLTFLKMLLELDIPKLPRKWNKVREFYQHLQITS